MIDEYLDENEHFIQVVLDTVNDVKTLDYAPIPFELLNAGIIDVTYRLT